MVVGEKNISEVLFFLCFLWRSFFVFSPFFRCFTFFQLRERVLPRPFQRKRCCCTYESSSENPQFYCINLRTASTREQPSIGPAQSSSVHTVVRSCRPECDNASKQAWKNKPSVAESRCTSILCFFRYFDIFPKVPLTLSPVTGRRLDHTIFSVDIGVPDATKNSRLFTFTWTTRSTLLLAVFLPPIDVQQALVQHTQCPCRFVMLETIAL